MSLPTYALTPSIRLPESRKTVSTASALIASSALLSSNTPACAYDAESRVFREAL
jgi:hypothetical protein